MPFTAYLAYRFGVREGEPMRNPLKFVGNVALFIGVIFLTAVTIFGWSGFVRGEMNVAVTGVVLAIIDGVLFTWVLIFCQRLDRAGAGAVFGLRFPLYVVFSGSCAALGLDQKQAIPYSDMAVMVLVGLVLTIPPLYALQKTGSTFRRPPLAVSDSIFSARCSLRLAR